MTRALLVAIVAALLAAPAHAAQCGCPAPSEPPAVAQGLPPLQPGGGYVFVAWVGKP